MGLSVFYGDIKSLNKNADIGFFLLPNDDGKTAIIAQSDKAIGYWPKGKNIKAAKKLIAFYASPEIDQMYCESTQMLPCIIGAKPKLDEAILQTANAISKVDTVFASLDVQWPQAASDVYWKAMQAISAGNTDVGQILADIDKAYDDNKNTVSEPAIK